MTTQHGRIKRWNSEKGYGFIARDQADDVFVHISQLQQGVQPRPGLEVMFELQQDRQGRWQAQQVRLPGLSLEPLPNRRRSSAAQPRHNSPRQGKDSHQPAQHNNLQAALKKLLALAALIFIALLLWKSIAPFYEGFSTPPGQTSTAPGLLVPGSPHAGNPQLEHTLQLIRQGGPFPYRQDGTRFQNREGRLPKAASNYYREYTVDTPGASNRGARRVVTGDQPPVVYYYTEDHYRSFIRLDVRP